MTMQEMTVSELYWDNQHRLFTHAMRDARYSTITFPALDELNHDIAQTYADHQLGYAGVVVFRPPRHKSLIALLGWLGEPYMLGSITTPNTFPLFRAYSVSEASRKIRTLSRHLLSYEWANQDASKGWANKDVLKEYWNMMGNMLFPYSYSPAVFGSPVFMLSRYSVNGEYLLLHPDSSIADVLNDEYASLRNITGDKRYLRAIMLNQSGKAVLAVVARWTVSSMFNVSIFLSPEDARPLVELNPLFEVDHYLPQDEEEWFD